jgi:hypothetical protein
LSIPSRRIGSFPQIAGLVFVDDLWPEGPTGRSRDRLYVNLDERYASVRSMCVTGNVLPGQLGPRIEEWTAPRLGVMCRIVHVATKFDHSRTARCRGTSGSAE